MQETVTKIYKFFWILNQILFPRSLSIIGLLK